jgi:glycosyltransferase involved in cell wall biosynthesis
MIRREEVSVFHAPADRGLPLRMPCPLVVTIHNSFERANWRTLFPTIKGRLWYWKNEFVNYWVSDAVLTVSETTRRELIKLKIAPKHKIDPIYLAPSPEFCNKVCVLDEIVMRKYQLLGRYILYVGGYNPHKNVDTLVKAFNQADLPEHLLVIVAHHQWEYFTLVEKWKLLPCFNRLRLIEVSNDEIPALYRNADFFVNPSLWESFSFQLVEAMACGTPILASNRKAIPEILGNAGILFDPEDINGLSRLIGKLARDRTLKDDLRKKGLERVKFFSWEKTAQETLNIYLKILGRKYL